MILDKDLQLSSAQALGNGTGTASTNYIDTGVARDLGTGEQMEVVVQVTTAMVGAGTSVVTLQQDDDPAFGTATTAQTIGTFAATSAAGTMLSAKLQPGAITKRYLRLMYTQGVVTAGAVSAHLALGVDHTKHYADNITIS